MRRCVRLRLLLVVVLVFVETLDGHRRRAGAACSWRRGLGHELGRGVGAGPVMLLMLMLMLLGFDRTPATPRVPPPQVVLVP